MQTFQLTYELPKKITTYLNKFGLDKWKLETAEANKYKVIVVVPAIMEYDGIRKLLKSLSENDKEHFSDCLVIFVINNATSAKQEIKNDNQKTLSLLRSIINEKIGINKITDDVINSGLNLGVVDAATGNLQFDDKTGGVGLARKIGMDLALTAFDYNSRNKNIIVCLDADCVVDKNYLAAIIQSYQDNKCGAAYIKFRHDINGENDSLNEAMICYELFLRYFVLGLKMAGSAYAFHSVGSTLTCDAESYIKIGGMNKRKAGEDFYFIEKLAKVTGIGYIDSTTVYPSGRDSWRVPFGTGQRIGRFNSGTHEEYLLYSFRSFLILKDWLNLFHSTKIFSAKEYLDQAKKIHPAVYEFLSNNSFAVEWERIIKNSKTEAQINKQKLLWFDGFRTFKFIHFFRDNYFPDEPMFDVLDEAMQYLEYANIPVRTKGEVIPASEQMKYLQIMRELA